MNTPGRFFRTGGRGERAGGDRSRSETHHRAGAARQRAVQRQRHTGMRFSASVRRPTSFQ